MVSRLESNPLIRTMKAISQHISLGLAIFIFTTFASLVEAKTIDAQWKVYQIRFYYFGKSQFYACDAIERKVRRLLILLGARRDARVESHCIDQTELRNNMVRRIQRHQRVNLAFAMPVPAELSDDTREIVRARWENVRVTGVLSRQLEPADCELIEQFRRFVVPRLVIRDADNVLHCRSGPQMTLQRNSFNVQRPIKVNMTVLKVIEDADIKSEINVDESK